MSDQLYNQWLAALARTGSWSDYSNTTNPMALAERQQCWYADALHQTGKTEQALVETGKLWLTADTPEACDAPFSAGWTARSATKRRCGSAWYWRWIKKQEQLARELAVNIREPYKLQARYALLLYRDPGTLGNPLPQLLQQPESGKVIGLTLKNLAKRAPEMAATLWKQKPSMRNNSAALTVSPRATRNRPAIDHRARRRSAVLADRQRSAGRRWLAAGMAYSSRHCAMAIGRNCRVGSNSCRRIWRRRNAGNTGAPARWSSKTKMSTKVKQANEIFAQLAKERRYYGFSVPIV